MFTPNDLVHTWMREQRLRDAVSSPVPVSDRAADFCPSAPSCYLHQPLTRVFAIPGEPTPPPSGDHTKGKNHGR